MDRIQGPQEPWSDCCRIVQNRPRDVYQIDGVEYLIDSLQQPRVRGPSRGTAALELGEPRRNEAITLQDVRLEGRRLSFADDKFQKRRGIHVRNAGHQSRSSRSSSRISDSGFVSFTSRGLRNELTTRA